MRRVVVMLLVLCAASIAVPAAAQASSTQTMTFEAPRELLNDAKRDGALNEIAALGVHNLRQLVYWHDFAPAANSRRRPKFDASDPAAYPAGTWDRLDRLVDAAPARGAAIHPPLPRTGPRRAYKAARRPVTRPHPG